MMRAVILLAWQASQQMCLLTLFQDLLQHSVIERFVVSIVEGRHPIDAAWLCPRPGVSGPSLPRNTPRDFCPEAQSAGANAADADAQAC
eukprot:CAMPEP_0183395738 /NCGR_PEP_ID=MMETSP0370-20130417/9538_1 /TAXON_ID=268820 /ORGANISM="Peridinium aciculiferum, Strain PAER-2" /LENGTH=88 /DNA_ID=CAMNT_0025576417 /DNA_START=194 /DNA_END=460 /DNA_ORIENTATION=+